MNGRGFAVLASALTLHASLARAEPSRAISLADSASPEAPVSSYAWGPRARMGLGLDVALLRVKRARIGFSALLAFEDADQRRVFPSDLGRASIEASVAWPLATFSATRALELGLSVGRDSAFSLQGFVLADRFHADDVPFGAGGAYLGADVAFRAPVGSYWVVTTRLGLRLYTNLFPDLVGADEASNLVADELREGAELMSRFEVGVRYTRSPCYQPLARVHMDAIEPHDDSAHALWLGRLLVAVALPEASFELQPFFDVEAGHGQSLLVNRNQLRLGAGVRLYAK